MTIVEQIHREFFTASEKIVNQVVPDKAKTLYELGFTSSEDLRPEIVYGFIEDGLVFSNYTEFS
jgi:hypothetical protein